MIPVNEAIDEIVGDLEQIEKWCRVLGNDLWEFNRSLPPKAQDLLDNSRLVHISHFDVQRLRLALDAMKEPEDA